MKNTFTISVGYMDNHDMSLIEDFSKNMPSGVKVETHEIAEHYHFEGSVIPLVITFHQSFAEGLFSGLGEFTFNMIMDKTKALISQYVKKQQTPASFEMRIEKGKALKSFKGEHVSDKSVDKAIDAFVEIVKSDTDKKSSDYHLNTITVSWEKAGKKVAVKMDIEKLIREAEDTYNG